MAIDGVLTVACGNYDRIQPLLSGEIGIESAQLDLTTLSTGPMLAAAARAEFDITEHSLSSYVMALDRGDSPYIAVPVFPSRMFRHNAVYVRSDSTLRRPSDLRGGSVGLQAWHITAMVWIRGIFAEHHDLPVDAVRYVLGGLDTSVVPAGGARAEPPEGVSITEAPAGTSLTDMLLDGSIDAIYAPGAPAAFRSAGGMVRRLFDDPVTVEQEYFRRTSIFPLMHVLVVRRSLVEALPELAGQLVTAFTQAKDIAAHQVADTSEVHAMEPWLYAHAERTRELLGRDFWPYGLEANRSALRTFLGYAWQQGLTAREWLPEQLFAAVQP
jgi:4,5-dihydroxyphthalate decarboxylase